MPQPDSGRGRTHNAEGAREAILNAAEEIFARHGFDGTRVDVIAEVAGYNKGLIFRYFGDKLSLYAHVIRRADEETRSLQNRLISGLSAIEISGDINQMKAFLRTFIAAYFDFLVEHPNYVRILNWEMAGGWQAFTRTVTERNQEDIVDFGSAVRNIEDSGWLRSRFDTAAQMILVLFTTYHYLGLLPLFKVFRPDFDVQSEEGLAQAREFIIEYVIHGLLADSGESRE